MTQLQDVNTRDIRDALELGCRAMSNAFNADDGDIPYGGASVRPVAALGGSSEAHSPGRHLNAILNAEDAAGIRLDEDAVDKHARAAFFSYSVAPLPLHRAEPSGRPIVLMDHNVREGFHALYALAKYRGSEQARRLAESSIAAIFEYWVPNGEWDGEGLSRDFGLSPLAPGYSSFVSRIARSIGPLVKHYRATGYGPALELALLLKDRALDEAFRADGAYEEARFGGHCHSTTCVMSSLAQLADLTGDASLMARVKVFYDNGLWEIRDEIGWSIEGSSRRGGLRPRRGQQHRRHHGDRAPPRPVGPHRVLPRRREDTALSPAAVSATRRLLSSWSPRTRTASTAGGTWLSGCGAATDFPRRTATSRSASCSPPSRGSASTWT